MTDIWTKVKAKINDHEYMSGVNRSKERMMENDEFFTPSDLVISMIQKILEDNPNALSPEKTVLEPSVGDGQFLVAIKWFRVYHYNCSEAEAVNTLYGIDIMQDNIDICRKRLGGGNLYCDSTIDPQTNEVKELLGIPIQITLDDFFV